MSATSKFTGGAATPLKPALKSVAPPASASAKPSQPPAKSAVKAPASAAAPAVGATPFAARQASGSSTAGRRSSGASNSSSRRRVVWDEKNLEANEEYQRTHPVTKHIDEPKTPYVHIDDDMEAMMDSGDTQWDPEVNAYVKKVKEEAMQEQRRNAPVAPVAKNGRPMLAAGTANGELEREQKDREFRTMRKAVYADEGAKFKEMLAKQKTQGGAD